MEDITTMARYKKAYYNRLLIYIPRNGISFMEDIRDRHIWTQGLLNMREVAILEELPEEVGIERMRSAMIADGLTEERQQWYIRMIATRRK